MPAKLKLVGGAQSAPRGTGGVPQTPTLMMVGRFVGLRRSK